MTTNKSKRAEDYHVLAESRGFRWLGIEVPNTKIKTGWECPGGHQWEARYNDIQQGCGCPVCANRILKTAKDYHALARSRGFRWLGGNIPNDVLVKTRWRCSLGHTWEAPYNRIQQEYGCPHCAGSTAKLPEDYHGLATKCGFVWLGPEVPNVVTKTLWECSEGHQWMAHYHGIQSGKGCPTCVDVVNGMRVSGPQRQLCEMLGGKLNYPCGSYRIDVALPEEKIAVEYDCWFWHGHKQKEDIQRDECLIAAGWKILHVRANRMLPVYSELRAALDQLDGSKRRAEVILDDWGDGPTAADSFGSIS